MSENKGLRAVFQHHPMSRPAEPADTLRDVLAEAEWADVVDVYGSFGSRLVADRLEAALAARAARDVVLVRKDSGGVFPDGTTNHPAIDFGAPATLAQPAPALDPYTNLAEHGRQSSAGTHSFDPACRFCLRLYWEDQQDAASQPAPALDVERLARAIAKVLPFTDDAAVIAAEYARLAASQPVTEEPG